MIPLYSIDKIPGQFDRRVFIGGNYDNCAVLREISKMVEALGYQPILALDFDVPLEEIRSYDLRLLASCKYAIFEISFGNGHLVEITRAADFNTETILVYQTRDETKKEPPGASQMVLTSAFQKFGYGDFEELLSFLRTFPPPLTEKVSRTLEIKYQNARK